MRVGIHLDIIICIGCSVGVGMKYIILAKRELESKPLSPEQYDREVKRLAKKYGI